MLKYTFKRILVFIPMLIAISLLSFIISINAPGDPVERLSKAAGTEGSAEQQSGASKKIKQELRKKLGLDLPIFYISISNIASTDTLYKVQDRYHKANLEALTHQCGNWQAVFSKDGVLDSKSEEFEITTKSLDEGEHIVALRVFDAMGNVAIGKSTVSINK